MKRILPLFVLIVMMSVSSSAWSQVGFRFSQKFQRRQAAPPVQSANQISGYQPPVISPPEGTYLANAKFPQVHYTLNRVARFRAGSRNAALPVSPMPSQQQAIFTPFHYPAGVGPTINAVPLPTANPSFDVDRSSLVRNDFEPIVESECPLEMPLSNSTPFPWNETNSAPIAITPPIPDRERIRQLLPPPVPERVQKVVPGFSPQTQGVARAKFVKFSLKSDKTPARPAIVFQEVRSEEPEQVTGIVDRPNDDEIVTTEDNPFGVDDVFGDSLDGENDSDKPAEAKPMEEIEGDPFDALFGDDLE